MMTGGGSRSNTSTSMVLLYIVGRGCEFRARVAWMSVIMDAKQHGVSMYCTVLLYVCTAQVRPWWVIWSPRIM